MTVPFVQVSGKDGLLYDSEFMRTKGFHDGVFEEIVFARQLPCVFCSFKAPALLQGDIWL